VRKQSISERAMNYLARREHSAFELTTKLTQADFSEDEILQTLVKLKEANLQSDERFCESYIRHRSNRGFGIQRIKQELKERGVDINIINDTLVQSEIDWFSLAVQVRCKRFGEEQPEDYKDRAKQQRFLQYRGFSHEQITESFSN
jgi:regulatory protein